MVDENVSKESLRALDAFGIRGTRFITTVKGGPTLDNLPGVARKIAELGWHIEMYVPRHLWRDLFPVLKTLPVPVVFDHMGGLTADTTDVIVAEGTEQVVHVTTVLAEGVGVIKRIDEA